MPKDEKEQKIKLHRPFWKKRRFVYTFKIFFVFIFLFDIYLETIGVPKFILNKIEERTSNDKVKVSVKEVKLGVISGLIIDDIVISNGDNNANVLKIESLTAPTSFSLLPFKQLIVRNAGLRIHCFPEFPIEARNDVVELQHLNFNLTLNDLDAFFSYINFDLDGIQFNGSGELENFLSYAYNKIFKKKQESITSGNTGKALKDNKEVKKESINTEIKDTNFLTKIPFQKRQQFYKQLILLKNSIKGAMCTFRIEQMNLQNSSKAKIFLNIMARELRYNELKTKNLAFNIILKGKKVTCPEISFQLENGDDVNASAFYDMSAKKLNATIKGDVTYGLLAAYPRVLNFMQKNGIKIDSNTKFDFEAYLKDYIIGSKDLAGTLNIKLPKAEVKGYDINDLNANIEFEQRSFICKNFSANIDGDVNLDGHFTYDSESSILNLDVASKSMLLPLIKLTRSQNIINQIKSYGISSKSPLVLRTKVNVTPKKKDLSFNLYAPQINIKDLKLTELKVNFSKIANIINLKNFTCYLDNNSFIKAGGDIDIANRTIVGKVSSNGSPYPLIKFLSKTEQAFIKQRTNFLTLPKKSDETNVNIEGYICYDSKTPVISLYGDMVMNNFALKKHNFRYGSATFFINKSNSWNITFPVVILERPEGAATATILFHQNMDSQLVTKKFFEEKVKNRLIIQAISNIKGDIALDLSLKYWDPKVVSFPYSSNAEVFASIDFNNHYYDYAQINIFDSYYVWNKIPIKHTSVNCIYNNYKLSFENANGKLAGGDIHVKHQTDFTDWTSNTQINAQDVNLKELAGYYDINLPLDKKTNGLVDINLNIDGKPKRNCPLQLYGGGEVKVKKSNLWRLPVVGSLQKLFTNKFLKDFGKITKASADLKFDGETVHINNIETDGNVISLTGQGEYLCYKSEYYFKIKANIFKGALPFNLMHYAFTPINWLLEAELRGTKDHYKWSSTSSNLNIFK
jgi:hypothetical protein